MRSILFALVLTVGGNLHAAEKLDFTGLHAVSPTPMLSAAPLDFSCLDGLCEAPKPIAKKPATKKPTTKPAVAKPPVKYRWELRCQNGQCYRVMVPAS